jgi:hypothetical protein
LQTLWERRWIDQDNHKKYYKSGKPSHDYDGEGVLKEDAKPWVLKHLLESCPGFANEISDMQHLGNELSDETCTVTVDFTP